MLNIKNKILLKKSYEVRKILDILVNCNYIVFLHIDKIYGESFEKLKQDLLSKRVNVSLLNKDRIIISEFSFIAKGPTLIVYSENFFYDQLLTLLEKNKISYEILLIKVGSYVTTHKVNNLMEKYKLSSVNVYNFYFFLMNFYRNFIFFINFIIKNYYKQLLFLMYNKLFSMFLLYNKILKINN